MHDLEIAGIRLVPNHPSGQDGDFGAENCFDSDLSTACRPVIGSNKSSLLIELGPNTRIQCATLQSCPLYNIKSITIYTPTNDVEDYPQSYHHIKVGWKTLLLFFSRVSRKPVHEAGSQKTDFGILQNAPTFLCQISVQTNVRKEVLLKYRSFC